MTPVRAMKTLIASIQKDLLAVLVNRDLMEMELFAKVRNLTSLFLAFQLQLEGFEGGEEVLKRGGVLWPWKYLELHHQKKRIQENINEGK